MLLRLADIEFRLKIVKIYSDGVKQHCTNESV